MARRTAAEIVVISWRDIPAQVNGRSGDERHQVVLSRRFQRAIDRAAMVAGKKTAHEYVGEWRRISSPVVQHMAAEVEATAAALEAQFPPERLRTLIDNGGWDPVTTTEAASQ